MIRKQNIYLHLIVILLLLSCGTGEVLCANDISSPETLLLKDFRPRSIYNIPQTTVEKARYPAIDMHAHPSYAKTPEQVARWVRIMNEAGIEKAIILTYTTGAEFDAICARYGKYPDRFELWYGLDLKDGILRKIYRDNALKIIGGHKSSAKN